MINTLEGKTVTIIAKFAANRALATDTTADIQLCGTPAELDSYLYPAILRVIHTVRKMEGADKTTDWIHINATFDTDSAEITISDNPFAEYIHNEMTRIIERAREKAIMPLY